MYPRVLVIANNCFSKTNSNGRTLANLFVGWPKENLANFFVSPVETDFDVCSNYYCVSDKEVIYSLTHFTGLRKRKVSPVAPIDTSKGRQKLNKKTPIKSIARNLAWWLTKWKTEEFEQWLDSFKPDVVLLMNTDAIFVLRVAEYVAKSRSIPLMMYNTEGFYFFRHNYMQKGFMSDTMFYLYQWFYRKAYQDMMRVNRFSFYLNSQLKEDYDEEFHQEGEVLYTASTVRPSNKTFNKNNPRFCYIGSFGYNRHEALIEVGEVLNRVNPNYILEVYGNPRPEVELLFKKAVGIEYRGVLSYDEVKEVMDECDVLFHVESQAEIFSETLKYGFSTKIADSISSGKPFIIYASSTVACSKYIKETGAGWFAENQEELYSVIRHVVDDEKDRNKKRRKAIEVARDNHYAETVCKQFKKRIIQIVNNG